MLSNRQRQLIEDNYPLAIHFINQVFSRGIIPPYLEDDFKSEVYWRFCQAALKHNRKDKRKFSTFAYEGCKFGTISTLGWINTKFKKNQFISSDDLEYMPEESNRLGKGRHKTIDKKELFKLLDKAGLRERDRVILMDYYFGDCSLREIGKKYGVSGEAVRVIIRKNLKILKRVMDRRHLIMEDFYRT